MENQSPESPLKKDDKQGDKQANLVFGASKSKRPSWQQLKYIGYVLSVKERWIMDICVGVIIIALVTLGFFAYFNNTEKVAQTGGAYTEGLVGSPERINPILAQTNDVDMDLASLVYSGLFKYNENQELTPDLITNHEISEDLLTYTLFIRRDAKWHDNEALTADDVLFTINAIQNDVYQSPLEPSLRGVTAEKVDDYTIKLTLLEPFSPFLSSLTFGILPKHIWYDIGNVTSQNIFLTEYNLQPVGSGPFIFDSLVKDKMGTIKSYHLIKWEDYYDAKPYLEELNFIFYYDIYQAVEALSKKQIDGLFGVPLENKEDLLKKNKNLNNLNLKLPQYTAIFFNQDHSEILDNDAVREALVWGVDREKIINEVLQGEGVEAYSPILKGYIGYNEDIEKYGFDIEKGKELLKKDGWVKNEEGYRENEDGEALEFTIATVQQPEYMNTLEILTTSWEEMGFKINIDVYAAEDIQEQIISERNYEALLFGEITGVDPDPYAFWHSSQQEYPGLALAIFYQKDIDNLLETARETTDEEQRRLKYFHFQNVLAEQIPAIFLYSPTYTYSINEKIKGIDVKNIPLPSSRFVDINSWCIKTERIRKKD